MLALIETHRSILIAIKSASSNEIEIRVEVSPRWKEDKDNVNLKIENSQIKSEVHQHLIYLHKILQKAFYSQVIFSVCC